MDSMPEAAASTRPAYLTDEIERTLRRQTPAIAEFLGLEGDLPLWEPPLSFDGGPSWSPQDADRLRAKKLPALIQRDTSRRSVPDLLLHHLGTLHVLDKDLPNRLQKLVDGDDHVYISNASGTGKTRLLFETLAHHWGFYFTCTSDPVVDPYGSRDLREALDRKFRTTVDLIGIKDEIPFPGRLSARWRATAAHNAAVAKRLVNDVILARLIVFEHFCNILRDADIPDERARLKWLLVQLCPRSVLRADVFGSVTLHVRLLEAADVSAHIQDLYSRLGSKIEFVAIDEANVAMETLPEAFMTSDYRRRVPILRELVHCMANCHPASRLLVAGTLLDEGVVSEPIAVSSSAVRSLRVFHDLGSFDTRARTSQYLRHFLDEAVTDEECETIHAWFQGRHRFLAVLVRYTLTYGAHRMNAVMDSIIQRFTGYKRSERYPFDHVDIGLAFGDDVLEESPVALSLRAATLNYALYERATSFVSNSRALVGLGAALYGADVSVARIFEPLIVLNLARWLSLSASYGILGVIKQKHDDYHLRVDAAGFVEGLAACLRDLFGCPSPARMQAALDFGAPAPAWAHGSARLMLPQLSRRRAAFTPYTYSTDPFVQTAESPDDVFRWLDNASRPFLIPDPGLGAALLFVVELADRQKLLISVDGRFLHEDRSVTVREHRLVPLRPDELYKDDAESRARLFAALSKFAPGPARGRRARSGPVSKYNLLHLLCFARPYRAGATYDPPAATLDANYLLQQPRPVEFELAHVLMRIGPS